MLQVLIRIPFPEVILLSSKYRFYWRNMSLVMRKPVFCICENNDADQLRGNRKADQHLCFCYTERPIPLLPKSEISSLQPSSVTAQPGLCRTWSETPNTGFLITRLKCRWENVLKLNMVILMIAILFHVFS